jgi:MFS transporter, DHA2 family, methylenomycin A resistance protein
VIASGAVLLAVGCAGLLGVRATAGYPMLVVPFVAMGFGLGTLVPAMTSALLGSVDRSRSGVAAGTLNTARQTGSVLGVAAFGSLIAGGKLVPGLHVALAISVAVALAAAALTARIRAEPG